MKVSQKEKQKTPFKTVAFVGSLAACCIVVLAATPLVRHSDYFLIRDITVKDKTAPSGQGDFVYLRGRNIFSVDLKKESRLIAEAYPYYREVRLVRVLPNRLFVDFVKRRPLAYVQLYRQFLVDEGAVIFDSPTPQELLDLPLISGLEGKVPAPRAGVRYPSRELTLALNIIQETKKYSLFNELPVKKINVANINNVSFFLLEGLEVKIGQEKVRDKIAVLHKLLSQARNEIQTFKYVDLRFKEPLIKFKDRQGESR